MIIPDVNQIASDRLWDVARQQALIAYEDIARHVAATASLARDYDAVAKLICDVAKHEHGHGLPFLSAVVVSKADAIPGVRRRLLGGREN